jgi:hypothetical protein
LNKERDKRENDAGDDDIRPEDGLVRYWMFINGEQVRLFSALAAVIFFVLWCFLYILGGTHTLLGIVLLVLAVISLAAWRLLDKQVREYEERGWKKDKRSPRREKIEIRVAIALWLLICIGIGLIILQQWRHSH